MASSVPQSLGDWICRMGFTQEDGIPRLTEKQLQNLTPPSMRPMWRHIMTHVRPKQEVEMIRKNLLLNKLRKDIKLDRKLDLVLGSSDHLEKYLEMNRIEKEINIIKKDAQHLRENIDATLSVKKLEKSKIEHKKEKIQEIITKTEICKVDVESVKEEIKKFGEVVDIINELKSPVLEASSKVFNQNKTNIAACMPQIKEYVEMFRRKKFVDKEEENKYESMLDMIREHTSSIPPKTIFSVFIELIISSNNKMARMAAEDPTEDTEEVKSLTKGFKSIEEHLIQLWKLHVDLGLQVTDLENEHSRKAKELQQCEKDLIMMVQNSLNINTEDGVESISEFVFNSSKMISLKEMSTTLKENVNKAFDDNKSVCIENFDLDTLQSKLINFNNDLSKKSTLIVKYKNSLALQNDILKQKIKKVRESVNETLTLHFNTIIDNPITMYQESISKKYELFIQVPLKVMTRKWDSDLLDYKCKQNILNKMSLSNILMQPDQNCLRYTLELITWLQILKKNENHKTMDFEDSKNKIIEFTDLGSDMKKILDVIKKGETEAEQVMSLVRFFKEQPLKCFMSEESS